MFSYEMCEIFKNCFEELLSKTACKRSLHRCIYNPVEHLQWSIYAKIRLKIQYNSFEHGEIEQTYHFLIKYF